MLIGIAVVKLDIFLSILSRAFRLSRYTLRSKKRGANGVNIKILYSVCVFRVYFPFVTKNVDGSVPQQNQYVVQTTKGPICALMV